MAKGGGSEIGTTKRGKGMKIMAIVDRHGLPLSVSTHAANHHEVRLVQLCFDFYMIEAKPENLIGDRAYAAISRRIGATEASLLRKIGEG
jgi:Transposase DDE domain